jgi:predicted ABC-type ATPase
MSQLFDVRPVIVVIAGPNGAGKSTFYEAFIRPVGLRFVNADVIAQELSIDAYEAAELAERMRQVLVAQRESFVFETVFSDPVGEFLRAAAASGYTVVLCFIGLDGADTSDDRVAMRVLQGGHDIPTEKLRERYPRSLANLKRAIEALPTVWVYDNSDLARPFRKVAEYAHGERIQAFEPLPSWLPPVGLR